MAGTKVLQEQIPVRQSSLIPEKENRLKHVLIG